MRRLWVLIAALGASTAGASYKCVDEGGVTHIGDTPPAGCANVVMYEMNRSGAVLRKIDPTPTPEQLKVKLEEAERMKETLKAQGEQKRKDAALLSTFSSEREFDVARDRNIEPLKSRIGLAQERMKAVEKRQQEIEEEMEFYKAGKSKAGKERAAPAGLTADLQRVRGEKVTLVKSVANYEKEIEQLRAKFDADKKRWLELKNPSAAKPAETAAADPKSGASMPPKAATKKN